MTMIRCNHPAVLSFIIVIAIIQFTFEFCKKWWKMNTNLFA